MCALDVSPRPPVTLFPATCRRHFPLHLLASLLPQHLNTHNTPPPPPSVCAAAVAAAFPLQQQQQCSLAILYVVHHLFLHQLIAVTLVLVCNFCLNTDRFGYLFICMWVCSSFGFCVRVSALELHWSGVGVFTRVCFSEGFFFFCFFGCVGRS